MTSSLYRPTSAHQFLSGDIATRIDRTMEAIEFDQSFEHEFTALKRVMPLLISITDIDIAIGAPWIPLKFYSQFCWEVFRVEATFFYSRISGNWDVKVIKGLQSKENTSTYAYTYVNEYQGESEKITIPAIGGEIKDGLFTMALHFKTPTKIKDQKSRREAVLKQDELQRIWSDWCKEGERGQELEKIYNTKLNRLVLPNWDNSAPKDFAQILQESGMTGVTSWGLPWAEALRPYQLDSIWRISTGGCNSLLGLEVGLGKTAVAIATVMLRKFYHITKKAMIVVQKSTLLQFYGLFQQMYPNAKVLCATPEDCNSINRQKFLAKAALWDWDCIILTHDSFKLMPVRNATEREYIENKLAVVEEELFELALMGESSKKQGKKRGNRLMKKLEEIRDKLWNQLSEITSRHDVGIHFEDIGIDLLIIDECQRYKNNYFATKMQVKGVSITQSERAQDFDLKLAYMRKLYKNNFLMFMTGTPEPTNSMAGVYVFQMYLQPEALADRNLLHFDAWAKAFGKVVVKIEPGISGNLQTTERFAEFVNVPELLQMYLSVCHIKRYDDVKGQAGFTRPESPVTEVSCQLSDWQSDFMDKLAIRRNAIIKDEPYKFPARDSDDNLLDPDGKVLLNPVTKQPIKELSEAVAYGLEWDIKIDNHLWIVTDARKNMIAPQLLDNTIPIERGDKIMQLVKRVYWWWKISKSRKSTQLVFLDFGTPGGSAKFPLYEWARDWLINRGIPANEIAFIQHYKTDEAKADLFDQVNAGEVRVLFGSTEPMGIGVNVQEKALVGHFVDIPRRPDEYEQRLGRIARSGNENEKVVIYQYLTCGKRGNFGADAAQMHLLETKIKSREQILRGDPTVRRVVEDDDKQLLFMMLSAHATGDIRFKRYMDVKAALEKQESQSGLLLGEINRINVSQSNGSIPDLKERKQYLERDLIAITPDATTAQANIKDCIQDQFECKVGDTVYTGLRQEVIETLTEAQEKPLHIVQAQKLVDQALQDKVEAIRQDIKANVSNFVKVATSETSILGEFGGFSICCRVRATKEDSTVILYLQGHKEYHFDYRTSDQRLIRNLINCYQDIAKSQQVIQERLDTIKSELAQAQALLSKKRSERETVINQITELKREKNYLEEALAINADNL